MKKLPRRPQVIAANKIDCFYGDDRDTALQRLKETFEPKGTALCRFPAVTGEGVKDLLYHCKNLLNELPDDKVVFEKEYMIKEPDFSNEPYTVERDENGLFVVEGPRLERMLGYTNLDSEKDLNFSRNS